LNIAWVGDSQCLVCRRATPDDVVPVAMTQDHRPSVESEAERVKKAGGLVVEFGGAMRVAHEGFEERIREIRRAQAQGLGTIGKEPVALAVSRSLGDRDFKAVTGKALLVATPSFRSLQLSRSDKFVTLMCDGISEVMSPEEVIDELNRVRDAANPTVDVRAACGALVQEAYKRGSGDNLTVIMVRLEWEGEDACGVDVYGGAAKRASRSDARDSAVAASKRRRLEAAAAVNAQKVAAYERDVAVLAVAMEGREAPAVTPPEATTSAEARATAANTDADVKAKEVEVGGREVEGVSAAVAADAKLQAQMEGVIAAKAKAEEEAEAMRVNGRAETKATKALDTAEAEGAAADEGDDEEETTFL